MAALPSLIRFLARQLVRLGWCACLLLGVANWSVLSLGNRGVVPEMAHLPKGATALVLGTSPRSLRGGGPSPFFEGRMDAAARTFRYG